MEKQQKKKQKIERVVKPYLRGTAVDRTLGGAVLKFFFSTVAMVIAYTLVGVVLTWDSKFLSILINGMILLCALMIFQQSGAAAGADAVNQGEIMYSRKEKGRPVEEWERRMCFHPAKGFIVALLGSIPLVLCSLILACVAQRQMTNLGSLPSWLTAYENRPEIGNALAFYHQTGSMTVEAFTRLIVRMSTMPYVNMVGAADKDGMLVLERISPLLNLLPAAAYGFGYLFGVQTRSIVHTNIALGKKKARRKARKEQRARQNRGTNALN